MALAIETFSNQGGASALFKAVGHPLVQPAALKLMADLRAAGPVAVYDPWRQLETVAALLAFEGVDVSDVFVQDIADLEGERLGRKPRPVIELAEAAPRTLFVCAFDADRAVEHIRPLIGADCRVFTLDVLKLPDWMIGNKRNYLQNTNFATNFAFFREEKGHHTRIVTANYWSGYGAGELKVWCRLIHATGATLAEWTDPIASGQTSLILDSAEIRARFGLGEFCGQLFFHVIGAAGHEIVKYALDCYGEAGSVLSCTHDANPYPSNLYAGLPAPDTGERVILWLQNSHPKRVPNGGIQIGLMGSYRLKAVGSGLEPFATARVDLASLFPDAKWPQQFEIRAGKHMVRPRYEVIQANGRQRIAHVNIKREDLKSDPKLVEIAPLVGKGFMLVAPILPIDRYSTEALLTPMSTAQTSLAFDVSAFDANGQLLAWHRPGRMGQQEISAIEVDKLLGAVRKKLATGYGHLEFTYYFGGQEPVHEGADGWLHGIFRYRDRVNGHAAETSFGSHMFNMPIVYKGEPQSYAGRAPGLSTRLFLRLGHHGADAICALIYPMSRPWHPKSNTVLALHDAKGALVAERPVAIAGGGSYFFRAGDVFGDDLAKAGPNAYVIIRDLGCRLFGYHGLIRGDEAFCLDHMFGF